LSLKQRLKEQRIILTPGIYDALSALIADQSGFEALYLSGASIAYTLMGRSDIGLTTMTEVCNVLSHITERVSLPIIVDGDTGFGNALNTQRTIKDFERSGASMIQLEDQSFPKRCGHLNGKSLISKEEMGGKLKAALDARASSETLILARTDAIGVEGFESAIERANYYAECGVDALFIEAPQNRNQMEQICKLFAPKIPLLANMVEGGKTPIYSAKELNQMGFRIVIFPGGTVRSVAYHMQEYFMSLKKHETTQFTKDHMLDFDSLNKLIGTPELLELGKKYEQ
jgi:2-methylisocitrate lyase-like PEP mutase family enzyme